MRSKSPKRSTVGIEHYTLSGRPQPYGLDSLRIEKDNSIVSSSGDDEEKYEESKYQIYFFIGFIIL
jgi:hypothetical protein